MRNRICVKEMSETRNREVEGSIPGIGAILLMYFDGKLSKKHFLFFDTMKNRKRFQIIYFTNFPETWKLT